jgi:hypothetical protein
MKVSNKKKNDRARLADKPKPICPNCGKSGPHYVAPSLGEEGFFICDNKPPSDFSIEKLLNGDFEPTAGEKQ